MAKGTLNGRVYSQRTIDDYCYYVSLFLGKYHSINANDFKRELMSIPTSMFAKREKYYKAILCFARFLMQEEQLDSAFSKEVKPLFTRRHLPPKRITVDEEGLTGLLRACKTPQEGLIIILLAHTGLRASEASKLKWDDIDLKEGHITVRLGKGNKSRKVGISSLLLEAIETQKRSIPSKGTAPVLLDRYGKPLERTGLFRRLKRLGEIVGIKASPHALRRAFVTINANKGRPLVILQRSCGHSNIKTTMSYCLTAEQEVIEAMKTWD